MPYTYLLTHIPTGLHYYGVRYSKKAKPTDLWVTYFSSSKIIKNMIQTDGKESFRSEIRKIFTDGGTAINWERRVLTRLNVPYNKQYLNSAITGPLTQTKREDIFMARYGYKTPLSDPKCREQGKRTNLEKYGVEYVGQSQEIRSKAKETNIARYGAENPMQNEVIQAKVKQTNQDNHGVDYSWQIPGVVEKSKETRMEKFGVEYSMQSPELVQKSKNTHFEKFGNWRLQSDEVRTRVEKSNIEKYGTDNPFKVPGLIKGIMKEKYGVENWFQTPEGKASITKGWENRTPMKCPHCAMESKSFTNMKRWHFDNCKERKL